MDRRDVLMVNQSLDQLGEGLLRDRTLRQQQGNIDTAREDRRREFDITAEQAERRTAVDEKQASAMEKNAMTNEAYRKQVLGHQQTQQAIAGIKQQVDQVSQLHKAGQISTAEANRKMKLLQQTLRDSTEMLIKESGLADFQMQDIPPKPDSAPADVDKDRAAAELEKQAATETDPARKEILQARAKQLRSGIGRQDPTQYIDDTTVLERDDDGKPVRTQKRKIPAGQTPPSASGKELTPQKAKEFLDQAKGDKDAARELARKAGYKF